MISPSRIWSAALTDAARDLPASATHGHLFFEDRRDLLVESWTEGDSRVEHHRSTGLAASGFEPMRWVYLAQPRPDQAPILVQALLGRASVPETPADGRPREEGESALDSGQVLETCQRILGGIRALHPNAFAVARWVGFEQEIVVGRPDRVACIDRRHGARLRIEIGRTNHPASLRVVGEVALRAGKSEDESIARLCRNVSNRLDQCLGPRALPSGERPIAFAPGAGGVLIHELVGHALEADALLTGESWLSGVERDGLGASQELTVVDDPRRGRAAWQWDDEGEPSRPTPLILAGRLVGCLHDRASATRMGLATTGHGRRGSFRDPTRPRMGCTFLSSGRLDPEEVLSGIEDGIYVRRMEAAHTDVRSGRAAFRVTDSDRICSGSIGAPLAPHVILVDARIALRGLDRIAGDLEFDACIGSCIRDGQPLPISVGGPTFRIGAAMAVF